MSRCQAAHPDWAADGSERPPHADVLTAPEALAVWGRRLDLAASDLPITGRELSAARALRLGVHGVFAAIASECTPGADALAALERHYAEAVAAASLAAPDRRWRLTWAPDDPRRIRFGVAISAIDLLTDATRLAQVRMCPGNNCGWLFLDARGRRRWCSMEVCGSRAKMRPLVPRRAPARTPPARSRT